MTRQALIINADDFGWSPSINQAVATAHDAGTVTSASLMANGPALEEAIEIIQNRPKMGVGLHLNLTQGRPLTDRAHVPSLLDQDGLFLSRSKLICGIIAGRIRQNQVRSEIETQLDAILKRGLKPSHIDGHQHVHVLPVVVDAVLDVARASGLALRMPVEELVWYGGQGRGLAGVKQVAKKLSFMPWALRARGRARRMGLAVNDHFRSPFGLVPPLREVNLAAYLRLLKGLRPGVTEIMVHPAFDEDAAELWSNDPRLINDRQAEAAILSSPELKAHLDGLDVSLINFSGLPGR